MPQSLDQINVFMQQLIQMKCFEMTSELTLIYLLFALFDPVNLLIITLFDQTVNLCHFLFPFVCYPLFASG